jgi:hypothetical protein
MAAVKINTGEAYHEDRLAESPRDKWTAIIAERRYYLKTNIDYDCRCLVQYVAEAEEFFAELGYESAEAMVLEAYDIQPEQAWAAVSYLEGRKAEGLPDVPLGLGTAALGGHGGDRRSEEAKQAREVQGDIITLKRGTQAAYIRARLERDHPDVAAALDRGEHRSARAAAIAAGIIHPVPTIRLVPDPAKVAASIRRHLDPQQVASLVEELLR